MPPDPRAHLWHARRGAAFVSEVVTDQAWDDFEADSSLQLAVERTDRDRRGGTSFTRPSTTAGVGFRAEGVAPLVAVIDSLLRAES